MSTAQRVVILAAHTDDEVLGVGGTIAHHSSIGDEVYVCSVCDRATQHVYDQAVITRLQDNARQAAETLGVTDLYFCGEKDEQLTVIGAVSAIESYIEKVRPHVVYTHHGGDSNQDHQALFKASVIVTRTMGDYVIPRVLCYEVPSATEQAPPFPDVAFLPNVFVDISNFLDRKLEAFQCYEEEVGEFPHPRSLRSLRARAESWGSKVGLTAAEPFVLVREVVR